VVRESLHPQRQLRPRDAMVPRAQTERLAELLREASADVTLHWEEERTWDHQGRARRGVAMDRALPRAAGRYRRKDDGGATTGAGALTS
jgi:hypothetical protein